MISIEEVIEKERLPIYINRRKAAEVISRHYFPLSHRSLEKWPVKYLNVNNKALVETNEILSIAYKKLELALTEKNNG